MLEGLENKAIAFAHELYTSGYLDGVENTTKECSYEIKADYRRGLMEGWECARRFAEMDERTYIKVTGRDFKIGVMGNITVTEAMEKIKQYDLNNDLFED